MKTLVAAGFVLHLFALDTHTPLNGPPWHIYTTEDECKADLAALEAIGKPWADGVCQPVSVAAAEKHPK